MPYGNSFIQVIDKHEAPWYLCTMELRHAQTPVAVKGKMAGARQVAIKQSCTV